MAVTYDTTLKNTRLTSVRDAINGGSIEIGTTGMASILAVLPLSATAGTVASGVLTFNAITSDTSADNTGTAAEARIKDSSAAVKVSGLTVGTSGANVNLNSTSITAGQQVSLSSGSITHG